MFLTRNLSRRSAAIAIVCLALLAAGFFAALPSRWSEDDLRQIQSLQAAMVDVRAAIGLVNSRGGALEPSHADEVLKFYERALFEAGSVDDALLRKVHGGLPEVWRTKLQRSTEIYISALKQRDRDLARQASLLQDDWIRWYNLHHKEMRFPAPDDK